MQSSLLSANSVFIQKDILPSVIVDSDQSALDHIIEAQILIDLGEYDKSIAYLNVISQRYKGSSKNVEARLLGGLARNHLKLGLNREAIKLWQDALGIIGNSTEYPYLQSVFHNNMSLAYINLGETEEAHKNLLKSLETYPLAQTYQKLSRLVLDRDKDFELSNFYLAAGLALINDSTTNARRYFSDTYIKDLSRANIIEGYAYHHFVKGEFGLALEKYQEVLSIAEYLKRVSLRVEILKEIGHLHQSMGNPEQANKYLTAYISLNDSLRIIQNNTLSIPMQNFIRETDKEATKQKDGNRGYQILFIVFITLPVFLTVKYYRQKRKNSELLENTKTVDNNSNPSSDKTTSSSLSLSAKTVNELLEKLKEFEASNKFLDENMSLSTLVGYLNSNTKYLRQVLRSNKNTDYNNYINGLRIQYILDKLRTDPDYLNYKISYLAKECGFSSHSKFSASFKKVTKLSPSEFINIIKNDNA